MPNELPHFSLVCNVLDARSCGCGCAPRARALMRVLISAASHCHPRLLPSALATSCRFVCDCARCITFGMSYDCSVNAVLGALSCAGCRCLDCRQHCGWLALVLGPAEGLLTRSASF